MTIVPGQRCNSADRGLRVGLVNNMPDSALAGTERQFLNLLNSAAPGIPIEVIFYTVPGIPRCAAGRQHLSDHFYGSTHDLADARLDAVIVTGTEPRQPSLENEPYWHEMKALFDFLEREGLPAIFSCLAAHAAVLHFDGIARIRLAEKRFGVFDHVKICRHELTNGLGAVTQVAHSRWNELSRASLIECGYRILTESPDAGVDLFLKNGRSDWLFFQGHPEYDPGTLGREFHREVKRHLTGERDTYPELPKNYFGEEETEALIKFHARAAATREADLIETFPLSAWHRAPVGEWHSPASTVFQAWLQRIADRKPGARRQQQPSNRRIEVPVVAP